MQLSGIVLSGGNAAWTGKELPDGVRGGILTAGTIAGMDLSGTDLAVLSACQTGLGKATPEGLYGLQRAFKKAGVCTVVMSLWEISNNVSQEFMTIFYERLMAQMVVGISRRHSERLKPSSARAIPNPTIGQLS